MEGRVDKFEKEKSKSQFFKNTISNVWNTAYLYYDYINNIRNLRKVGKI